MKKILISVIAMILAFACIGSFAACNNTDSKTIVVGITDYEPMDYQNDKGEWIGFDADLANEFGKEYGYKIQFQVIDWDSKGTELNSGNIDLIWNGMTADEALLSQMDFSVAYATNYQCIVVKASELASYTGLASLDGKKIAVERGSAANTVCTETLNRGDTEITAVDSQVLALAEVKSGTSPVAMVDYTLAYNVVGKNTYADLAIVNVAELSFENEVFAVGARKNSELLAQLNSFFAKKYKDGSLRTLAEKYNVALNEETLAAAK